MPDSRTGAHDEEGGPQHMSPTVTQGEGVGGETVGDRVGGESVGDKQLSAAVTQGEGAADDAAGGSADGLEQEGGG